jgi:DNA-binding transcriptional MerR regulator
MTETVFYLNLDDTCTEVGISKRQLLHWQDNGLLAPCLGPNTRKYTPADIARLRCIAELIADFHLTQRIIERMSADPTCLPRITACIETLRPDA